MKKTTALRTICDPTLCIVSGDVGLETINLAAPTLSRPGDVAEWEIKNRSRDIRAFLEPLIARARAAGFAQLRVVAESTGIYHELLLRIARSLGCETNLVNAEHVVKMRSVVFGDNGKTDQRDPLAIDAVARQGRLIIHRQLPEVYRLMRQWSKLYEDAEESIIEAKARIHRSLRLLFPDLTFKSDFIYGDSGAAIMRCYGFNPHRIAAHAPSRLFERLRTHSHILRASVDRLLRDARESAESSAEGRENELLEYELGVAWNDLTTAGQRREKARVELESLYGEARREDPRLPESQAGVVSTLALARFFAESGPMGDFESWRQVLKMAGLNLRERKSGKYTGLTKITRGGRVRMRVVLNRMALALVKRDRLFGEYYHRKTKTEKMPGKQAMTAVSRKLVKMLWGWYHAAAGFDVTRIFACEGEHKRAA